MTGRVRARESGEWGRVFLTFTVLRGPAGAADVEMRKHVQGSIIGFGEMGRVEGYPFVVRCGSGWVGLMQKTDA